MNIIKFSLFLFLSILLTQIMIAEEGSVSADELYYKAVTEQKAGNFTNAKQLFIEARQAFLHAGNRNMAKECLSARQDMLAMEAEYSLAESALREELEKAFPDVPEDETESWIADGSLEHMIIDGRPFYFADVITNIKFRNVELFRKDTAMLEGYKRIYHALKAVIDAGKDADSWQPFVNPISYRGNGRLLVPRDKLPETGLFQVWFPVPLLTGPQNSVRVTSAEPAEFVQNPPSIDADIGLVYMAIDLAEVRDDLDLSIEFIFDHYEQRFTVNPENIGEYDKESALYIEYTTSRGNITISPEIKQKAEEIVGDEKNPFEAARKIYNYILQNIKYSLMPHLSLWPRGIPESVYVHEHRHGDCGAQSMYFSALCRAVGIPARTTGGWQLFSGKFSGHFWAEFYLPNYGWIPVDTTAGEIVDYLPDISDEDRRIFHDFFFGNQDHFRCIVQKDVDVPLIPPADGRVILPLAIQFPAIICDTMEGIPGIELIDYWKLEATIL